MNRGIIDCTVLDEPISKKDISAYRIWKENQATSATPALIEQLSFGSRGMLYALFCTVFVFFIFSLTASILQVTNENVSFFETVSFPILFFSAVIGIMIFSAEMIKRRNQSRGERHGAKLYKFATANGLTYFSDTTYLTESPYKGIIFRGNYSGESLESYIFPDETQIGNYARDRGKHAEYWSFVKIKLPRHLPHMVVDTRGNNFFGLLPNLPVHLKARKMSLEGDFDKYFTLYAPEDYERDALYIFTPDVMAALIDSGKTYDMEIIDDQLIIFKEGLFELDSEEELTNIIYIIDIISSQLHKQASLYSDERTGNRTHNEVAEEGRRIYAKPSVVASILTVTLIIIYFTFKILWEFTDFFID